jgi:hypothetical protein
VRAVDFLGMPNPPRPCRVLYYAVVSVVLGGIIGGCLYDPDHRCGPAMTFVDAAKTCVCDSNAVAVTGGCKVCASDEVPVAGKCGCAAGQTKNADNVCAAVTGLGDACDTATQPCTNPQYSYCAVKAAGTAGTCTKTCGSDTDCDSSYTCADWEAQPYCRTFEGVGDSCASSADCTKDAQFCDTFQTHTCVIQGCSLTDQDCPRNSLCCDFSGFGLGTLCAGACQ